MEKIIDTIADLLCVAAITAPKAKGINNIVVKKLNSEEKQLMIKKILEIAEKKSHKGFIRDANGLEKADAIILIGTKFSRLNLKVCGQCGAKNCSDAETKQTICIYNPGDLGIALGSLVSKAADFRVDNRIMYSAGYAAKELKMLGEDVKLIFAVPLSVTGKNIFFDR